MDSTPTSSPAKERTTVAWPLFHQDWWLDAVSPGGWDVATVRQDDRVVARLPYVRVPRFGGNVLTMPPLTQFLGPWIAPLEGKNSTQLTREHELNEELIGGLPEHASFFAKCSPQVANVLPFIWAGFETSVRYTYRIEELSDADAIWKNYRESARRQIRKAKKQVELRDDLGVERFLELNRMTFERQNQSLPYEEALVRRLDEACTVQDCRRILFAVDENDRVHGALYLVWDADVCYYLMSGGDPDLRNSGAMSLLIHEAITRASETSKIFDFEGSMIRPIERFFRSFGAAQQPYIVLERRGRLAKLKRALSDAASCLRSL
ncbi:MAG: GNAT family N-acetyltransferase [Planctomycetota bacterium]